MSNMTWFHANNKTKKKPIIEFAYTGEVQILDVPGTYMVEIWGGNGGVGEHKAPGGYGGYTKGTISLSPNNILYLVVGEQGGDGTRSFATLGGWKDGGMSLNADPNGGGGGGSSYISLNINEDISSINDENLLLVAGGGGGGSSSSETSIEDRGGDGGGIEGGRGNWRSSNPRYRSANGFGGSQTSGGSYGFYDYDTQTTLSTRGTKGQGGDGGRKNTTYAAGAGGGGYYGGGGGVFFAPGGGGSGYVGTNTVIIEGNTYRYDEEGFIPNPDTSGNGFIRVTKIA